MIDDILSRLEKVRRTGRDSWLACCPAHDDRNPSMTMRLCDDGRILAKCHAACGIDAIVDAVGLGWDVWFPEKPIEHAKAIRRPFPAADVLAALADESLLVAVAASKAAKGELNEVDRERMLVAAERILEGRSLALGR